MAEQFECQSCGMTATALELQRRVFRAGACGWCGGVLKPVEPPPEKAATRKPNDSPNGR